ncbi:hypothetical protein E2C01_021026 [Portunus trituberculatus]|uniref:Uncharacterized protein n=1 Tax=Portunus trituberculatus TaxID=210409 RepID=A0A5B7E1M8_PORTR|nr:hypothetical protein [Portunus trituberculatus]
MEVTARWQKQVIMTDVPKIRHQQKQHSITTCGETQLNLKIETAGGVQVTRCTRHYTTCLIHKPGEALAPPPR